MKRFSIITILITICLVFSSCGMFSLNSFEDETTVYVPDETTAEISDEKSKEYVSNYELNIARFLKDLSGNVYEGSVRIAIAGTNVITGDDNTSKIMSDEWTSRNEAVENNLGVSIIASPLSIDTLHAELKASALAGTYYCDLIMIPQSMIGSFYISDMLCNLRSLPGFDMNVDYLYSTAVAAGTAGNDVYGVAGPGSLNPDSLACMYFNRNLMASVTDDDIYDVVKSGEWTLDKFNALSASLDSEHNAYSSKYIGGYTADLFFFGIGGRYTYNEVNNYPGIVLGNENVLSRAQQIKKLFNSVRHFAQGGDPAIDNFASGKSLFLVDELGLMKRLANSSLEWGVLPMPKVNNTDQNGYFSLSNPNLTMFFAVPPTATDYEKSADLLNALNIFSYGYNKDSYVLNSSYYYLRDSGSIDSVNEIVSIPVYDFAYTYINTDYTVFGDTTFETFRNYVNGYSEITDLLDVNSQQFAFACSNLFNVNN